MADFGNLALFPGFLQAPTLFSLKTVYIYIRSDSVEDELLFSFTVLEKNIHSLF